MIKEKREDRIVANQFNILIPVGIAIIAFTMNSGPQHPATHEVLRLIAILHGEIIQ